MTSILLTEDLPDELASLVCCEQLLGHGSRVRQYCSVVPGLLQTPSYAAEAHQAGAVPVSGDELDLRVRLRMARQKAWLGEATFDFLLDESAIRRDVGAPTEMFRQLAYLLAVAARRNVTIRVLPYAVGIYAGITHGFQVLEVSPGNVYVYCEAIGTDYFELNPPELGLYTAVFERAATAALSPEESRMLINEAMNGLPPRLLAPQPSMPVHCKLPVRRLRWTGRLCHYFFS
jgi:hypothetical protein